MKKILLVLLLLILCASAAEAGWWSFEDRRYYESLIAGVREPHLSALALAQGKRIEFQVSSKDPRMIWDIDAGGELPIVGYESAPSQHGRVAKHAHGIGLWIPIDFHMIEDLTDRSGPVVNNDYRFGGMFKAQYGLTHTSWVAARLHVGHESTHLGDEFSIVGERQFRTTFERINVSWEYADLGFLYERSGGPRMTSVRAGVTYNLRGSYYATDPDSITFSPRGRVTPSKNRYDPYAGFDRRWQGALFQGNWDVYASGELRWRSIFDYHKTVLGSSEARQGSINLIAGVKVNGDNKASPFLRYYRGVNPHGQFRNQKSYTEYGLGVRLVR
jgi:hypothetical protein